MARSTSGDSVCARASRAPPTTSGTSTIHRSRRRRVCAPLRRRCTVDAREVVEDRAPLVGRKPAHLLPRRRLELDRRLRVDGTGWRERLVPLRRRRFALAGIVAFVLLERAPRVEQTAEELLLPRERAGVETTIVERIGQLPRLACELRGAVAPCGVAGLLELIGDVPLLPRELPRQRLSRPGARAAGHRQHPLRLRVELTLLLRHLLHLLEHLADAGRALRAVRAFAVAGQCRRRLGERARGLAQRARLLRRLTVVLADALRRLRDLRLRLRHGALRARREERALARRALDPLARLVDPLLDRALRRSAILALPARPRLLLQRALLMRELHHLLHCLIQLGGQLLLPIVHLRLARVLHRLRGLLHLRRGVTGLALALLAGLLAGALALSFLARLHRARRATHPLSRLLRVLLRLAGLRRARRGVVLRETLLQLLHRIAQPLRTLGQLRRFLRALALGVLPLRLLALRVLALRFLLLRFLGLRCVLSRRAIALRRSTARRVGECLLLLRQLARFVGQRLHRTLVRRALEHFRAARELFLEPLLHLREVAQRIARLLAVHLLRGILELLHLRHQLGGQRLAEQRLRFAELSRERRVERTGGLELLLELLRRLSELLHAIRHAALLLGERTRPLGALVVHRLLGIRRRARALRRALAALRAALTRLGARRLVGALRERLLRRGRGARFLRRRIAEHACFRAAFLDRRALDDQVAAHAALRPRRCIHDFGTDAHRVARLELQRGDVEPGGAHPRRAHRARHRLPDSRPVTARTQARDAQRQRSDPVVVRCRESQSDALRRREHGVSLGSRDLRARRRVDEHLEPERRGQGDDGPARRRRQPPKTCRRLRHHVSAECVTTR